MISLCTGASLTRPKHVRSDVLWDCSAALQALCSEV